jgi:hypothetical protein
MLTQPSNELRKTIDYFTRPGTVQMVHKDSQQLDKDYKLIHELELESKGFFTLQR